jgi:calcium-dependent protein kinase
MLYSAPHRLAHP